MLWTAIFRWQWTGIDHPVYHPVDMVNPRLNGTGMVTILQICTYCEVWSRYTALITTTIASLGPQESEPPEDPESFELCTCTSSLFLKQPTHPFPTNIKQGIDQMQ